MDNYVITAACSPGPAWGSRARRAGAARSPGAGAGPWRGSGTWPVQQHYSTDEAQHDTTLSPLAVTPFMGLPKIVA